MKLSVPTVHHTWMRGTSRSVEAMRSERRPACTRRQVLTLFAGSGAFVVLGGALAACDVSDDTQVDEIPADAVDVTTLGAVGDGRTDDTAALQKALDSLKDKGILEFPAGKVFLHDDVLTLSTAGVQLVGTGELRATDEEHSAVRIEAADVTVQGLTFGIENTTRRWSTPDQHKLFIGEVSGVTVRDVRITGSAAAGLFALGTSDFHFERVAVFDTRADGIHMTYGAHSGTVDHPVVTRSGDDGVAVVSYLQDARQCHDIEVISPAIRVTTGGRGISVVGGRDITYRDISVDRSAAAAVYVACEGDPSNTENAERIVVSGGRVTGANTDADIDNGAVLVYSGRGGGAVADIQISDLSVSATRSGASRQIGAVADSDDSGVTDVTFRNMKLSENPQPYQGNAPISGVELDAVTADGRSVPHATVS